MKSSTLTAVGLFAVTAIIASCGSNTPLSDAQKAQLGELNQSTKSVIQAGNKNNPSGRSAVALAEGDIDLSTRINSADCDFEEPNLESSDLSSLSNMNFKVSGENCPILMDIGMRGSANSLSLKMYFEIKDAELAASQDVTKADLSGTFSGSESSMSGALSGVIVSKKYGNVGISMNLTADAGGAKMDLIYEFADFSATLTMEANESGVKYLINGEEVSEAQFSEYNITNDVVSSGAATSTVQSSKSLSYEYEVNGCSTGKQTFDSEEALCEALKSESLNNGCAQDLRELEFQAKQCPGNFVPEA